MAGVVVVLGHATCKACHGPLQLWGGKGRYWVHVTGDGQYVYQDHKPAPNKGEG